jgi:hypothetical protein
LLLIDVGIGFCVESVAALPSNAVTNYRFITPTKKWSAMFRARMVRTLVASDDPAVRKFVRAHS